jgi:hypothetical protein
MTRLKLIAEHPVDERHEQQFSESYGRAMLSWQSTPPDRMIVASMNSWHDYIAPEALLPAAGWLVATYVALHSLWLAKNDSRRRMLVFGAYSLVAVAVAIWYTYEGVQTLRSNRETERNIKTLLALSGLSSENVNQGLDRLITRNLQPRQIIPTQEEVLADAFELLKGVIPKRFAITTLPTPTPDSWGIEEPIHRAFARNGINVPIGTQSASSPRETGIMFTMPDPSDPPEFALKLKDAFGLAGIHEIRFVRMGPEAASQFDFTIFVGPAPLR